MAENWGSRVFTYCRLIAVRTDEPIDNSIILHDWGSRGREFKSRHSDHAKCPYRILGFYKDILLFYAQKCVLRNPRQDVADICILSCFHVGIHFRNILRFVF